VQKCAPTFGAVPSAKDLKKKEEEQVEAEEKRDEILAKFMQKDAIDRVNKLEMSEPAKAERVREQLLAQRAHWRLNGPVTVGHIAQILEDNEATDAKWSRGLALDRRRFGDDSDSDIDLDGL